MGMDDMYNACQQAKLYMYKSMDELYRIVMMNEMYEVGRKISKPSKVFVFYYCNIQDGYNVRNQ